MMKLPDRFLNWFLSADGRKLPCRVDGTVCDAHDPANHVDYHTAATAAGTGRGVAYALSDDDGWFFMDLDKCLGADGSWSAEAVAIWQSFPGAWGEISQSGTGLHIMGRCDPRRLADRKHKWSGWIEFYTGGRFIAFGRGWAPIGGTEIERDWTDQLLRIVPQRTELGELPVGVDPAWTGPEDDETLIRLALASRSAAGAFGGVSFADLWTGNAGILAARWPAYDGGGGFDRSSADAALMSHLAFWTGKDAPRMDRLFRRSALMRDKYRDRADYRTDTVNGAIRLCRKVYDVPRAPVAPGAPESGSDVFLTVPEMIEHFKGCVYVRDMHRVLVPDGALLKPEQFNATYGGHLFTMMPDGTKPSRKAFEAFTECAVHRFPFVHAASFHPEHPFGTVLDDGVNIYVPAEVKTRPGDVSRFLTVIERILPVPDDRAILLAWACWVVQNPGRKALWAPVLQGAEGNGKSMLGECMAYAIGERYVHRPRAKELGSTFNAWQANRLLILVEEIHISERRELLDDLKPNITQYRLPIRDMQTTEVNKNVPTNWYFTTNHKDAVIKQKTDRRLAVFFTRQQTREDVERDFPGRFFPEYWTWLREEGGFEAVAHWLRTTPPDPRFSPDTCFMAPRTSSTEAAIIATRGPIEAEIVEAVGSEMQGFRGGWISSWALDQLLRNRGGLRASRAKLAEIVESMGYENAGRSGRALMREEMKRPVLWRQRGVTGGVDEYLAAQGPGYG